MYRFIANLLSFSGSCALGHKKWADARGESFLHLPTPGSLGTFHKLDGTRHLSSEQWALRDAESSHTDQGYTGLRPQLTITKDIIFGGGSFILKTYFMLEYKKITTLWQFQVNIRVVYIYPSTPKLPKQAIKEHGAEFPVLYSRSLLAIHFKYSS